MPHCIIEHSVNLAPKPLLDAVLQGALDSQLFDKNDIKIRAQAFEHYQTNASQTEFVHVVVKILSGRSEQQQSALSGQVLERLKTLKLAATSLTVEIVEMPRVSYAKALS